jgi:hypothetical protein
MTTLVLEDRPERQAYFLQYIPDAVIVATYEAAVAAMTASRFEVVYMDYDIAGSGYNGSDVAWWMVHTLPKEDRPGRVFVHSSNNAGARAIMNTLEKDPDIRVKQRPYPPTLPEPA